MKMQSYWMEVTAGQANLQLKTCDVPSPGAGQVLIKVKATSLNRGEFLLEHGLHGEGTAKPIGIEAAGIVQACGPGVTQLKPGDEVLGRCKGGFSEYAVMDVAEAIPKPASLTWEQSASLALTYLTAYDCLVIQGRISPGEWVLIPGVSSGVGVSALGIAKALGAKVIGTSGSQHKLDKLMPLGLDIGICLRGPGFHEQVMQVTGQKGVDIVVNTVGGTVFEECLASMAFQGRLATVGYVDNVVESRIDLKLLHARRLTIFGVSNKQRTAAQKAEAVPQFKQQIMPFFEQGKIVPLVDKVFAFQDLALAIARMQASEHVGKIVLLAP